MDLVDAAIARLVAVDPQASLDELLAVLEAHTDADISGLFAANGGGLSLVALRGLDSEGLRHVRELWSRDEQRLLDGRPTCEDCRCLWPIDTPSRHGLIYLEAPDRLSVSLVRQAVTELGPLICTALEIKDMPTSDEAAAIVDDYLQATPTEAVRRRQLTTLLNNNEWNLSRVARLLGVTRVTVYNRMRKFGIARIRVPKTRG